MITLLEKRDRILSSLRDQFKTKVALIVLSGDASFDEFLRDLANNITQGLADEDDE